MPPAPSATARNWSTGRQTLRVLTVPGLCCSGPGHWQSHWERERRDCGRIELPDWDDPDPAAWIAAIDRTVAETTGPIVIAAHSLGCHAIVGWALTRPTAPRKVAGALLVAPPDPKADEVDPRIARFAQTPLRPLPFPAKLVASRDDSYARFERLREMADGWKAELVDVGRRGHINAASGLGPWKEGQQLAEQLLKRCAGRRR